MSETFLSFLAGGDLIRHPAVQLLKIFLVRSYSSFPIIPFSSCQLALLCAAVLATSRGQVEIVSV